MKQLNQSSSPQETQEEVAFSFEGKKFTARKGQSVAAALLNNGIKKIALSKKFGEPRGAYCLTGRCYSCTVNIDGCSHVRACMAPVQENMKVEIAKGYFDVRDDDNGL
ncbi:MULTISPECIES: (2Fe-2S)-binding protein [Heyndrickxia]|jgi:sarcosine oxidase subunit alpha|uniref:2Fe-2S ferredoxin-type domain-containing protein n=2 Tax=Heyndrickxia TaxID=2837504 RepID=A0A133KNI1_HEYCO|nr:(2Fe-2S)-binding protein [Heyndrickxia coagulans]AWP36466.1 pyridine nucleotide-disulfide oxidoreductase [Heyndrickxia coagulans]KWZ81066.1 hypothetical protein HMPREF3213_02127 [Heyndrickxia coagulans]QDI61972.1 (2Fe-2S)-binding protein [Heyndrickxia coagulans]UXC23411.1 (2Fe-2S)-binding protein [Heyndrickxia coagulans]